MTSLERNLINSLLGGSATVFLPINGRRLRVRNYKAMLLAALLIGAVNNAFAIDPPYGANLNYAMDGTTLVLTSPNSAQPATIYSSAFLNRTDITAVIFPDNLTDIYSCAFKGCTGLTEIVIPPSVTNIGVEAFYGCTSLRSVLCRPYTAPVLGNDVFTNCASGLQIFVPNLGSYNTVFWNHYTIIKCDFLDEYDEESVTASKITSFRSTSKIDIFRTLRKAGCFNTLTLPFNVPNIASSPLGGDNVEVYTFTSATVEDGTLVLDIEKVTSNSLTAGTPYLIQWTNTGEVLHRMTFTSITWDTDQTAETASSTHVNYVGFYGRTHIDDDANHSNLFLGGNNTLYWPTDGDNSNAKMLGFRAYFHVNTSGPSPAPIYRGMPASLRIKSTPTDVEQITNDPLPMTHKTIKDGQIIIIRNGEQFSITGQKL